MRKFTNTLLALLLVLSNLFFQPTFTTHSATLSQTRDTLIDPRPSQAVDHSINFTTVNLIPVSGKITLEWKAGSFNIPGTLSYQDIDFKINGTDQSLGATPGTGLGSNIGVNIISGTSGNITFTLNDTNNIAGGSTITILIGKNTNYQTTGTEQITNPVVNGSYTYTITTKNAVSTTIDSQTGAVSINPTVSVTGKVVLGIVATPDITPNGGSFVDYVDVNITDTTPGSTIYFTTDGSTPTTSSNLYTTPFTLYSNTTVKAFATAPSYDDSSVATAVFSVTPSVPPVIGYGPENPTPIIHTNQNGLANINQKAVDIIHTCPNSVEVILKIPSNFYPDPLSLNFYCLPWNTLPETVRKAGSLSTPPVADTVILITAEDNKGKIVEYLQNPLTLNITYTSGHIQSFISNSLYLKTYFSNEKNWSDISGFSSNQEKTFYTAQIKHLSYFGVFGQTQKLDCKTVKADLNCDGRVNLVDLSILLYNWDIPKNIKADLNNDTRVNLVDFSILLFYWTN